MSNTNDHRLIQRGILHKVYDAEQKTEKFRIREFVIKIPSPHYEQYGKFQLTNDRCDLIEPYDTGDEIEVYFDIHGREWNGNYYTNLNAWRIKPADAPNHAGSAQPPTAQAQPANVADLPEAEGSEDDDDLPF